MQVLSIHEFPNIMQLLELSRNKEVSISICNSVVRSGEAVTSPEAVKQLLLFVRALVEGPLPETVKDYEVAREQQALVKLLHCLRAPSTKERFALASLFLEAFRKGGERRARHNHEATFYLLLGMLRTLDDSVEAKVLLEVAKELIQVVQKLDPYAGIRMNLSLALTINHLDSEGVLDEYTYDILKELLLLYTEELT